MPWSLILVRLEESLKDIQSAHSAAISEIYTMREYQECRLAVLDLLGGGHCCEQIAYQTWALIRATLWMSPEEIQAIIPKLKPVCQCERGLFFLQDKIQGHDVVVNRRQVQPKPARIFISCSSLKIVP